MHLIEALAAGVRGAESGTAFLYQRGTSTLLSSYYSDFEATAATTQAATGIALDSHGGAVVYVDTLCKVVVKSSTGSTIRTFVAGVKDSAVEVISDSFTGTDYSNAATGVSKPTTLQSVLNRWNDSAGTTNFQVLVGGVATNIQTAVQGVGGFFYNVKSSVYGAVGDGTTDDTASLQAAIDAADDAGGGIVVFPAGTYRTTDVLTVPYTVSLLGVGAQSSAIELDSAATSLLVLPGHTTLAVNKPQSVVGLGFSLAQANGTKMVSLGDPAVVFSKCHFESISSGGNAIESTAVTPTSYNLTVDTCYFTFVDTLAVYAKASSGTSSVLLIGNTFKKNDVTWDDGYVVDVGCRALITANTFDMSTVTATTGNRKAIRTRTNANVVGNTFGAPGHANGDYIVLDFDVALASASDLVYETGNALGANVFIAFGDNSGAGATQAQYFLTTNRNQWLSSTGTAASYDIDAEIWSSHRYIKTSGATLSVTSAALCSNGTKVTFSLHNSGTGGNIAITWSTGIRGTGVNVANNKIATFEFVCWNAVLYQVGTPRDETP